jgi:hypothetical protein
VSLAEVFDTELVGWIDWTPVPPFGWATQMGVTGNESGKVMVTVGFAAGLDPAVTVNIVR